MPRLSKPKHPLKYPLHPKKPLIIIYAQLIGPRSKRTLKMALDTGTTYTIIPIEAAIAIGRNPARSCRRIEITTRTATEYAPVITIPRFKSLGKEVKNLKAVCRNLSKHSPVDGLLGLNFLSRFNVYLKFRKGILEVI